MKKLSFLAIIVASIFITTLFDLVSSLPENFDYKLLDLNKRINFSFVSGSVKRNVNFQSSNSKLSDDIWIVGIDTTTLEHNGRWPFKRSVHSTLLDSFTSLNEDYREKSIFLDIIFNEETNEHEDNHLSEAILNNSKVYIETLLEVYPSDKESSRKMSRRFKILSEKLGTIENVGEGWEDLPIYYDFSSPLELFGESAIGYGHANLHSDIDEVYRRQQIVSRVAIEVDSFEYGNESNIEPLKTYEHIEVIDPKGIKRVYTSGETVLPGSFVTRYKNIFVPAISLTLALDYLGGNLDNITLIPGESVNISPYNIEIPIDPRGSMLINYSGPRSSSNRRGYQTFPVRSYSKFQNIEGNSSLGVDGKILMVGPFAPGMADDEKNTPFGMMYGVEIHANALNTIIMDNFIYETDRLTNLIILLLISILLLVILSRKSLIISLTGSIGILVIYLIFTNTICAKLSLMLPGLIPILHIVLSSATIFIYKLVTEGREKAYLKGLFGKYVNPSVVEQLIKKHPELGGIEKEITVLFSDIRGFTSMSEGMESSKLINLLNEYLSGMTDIILKNDGTLDKYIGDAIMCFWGAPLDQRDHYIKACNTALEMSSFLKEFNKDRIEPLNIGIGINTGIMSVGNVGSRGRMSYTVIGDSVNLASRIEGLNKNYSTEILISHGTYELIKNEFETRLVDEVYVKGKAISTKIYELIGRKSED